MKSCLMYYPKDNAVFYNRVFLPYKFLHNKFNLTIAPTLDEWEKYDAVWVHGVYNKSAIADIMKVIVSGRQVIWGIDDDYNNIPTWSSVKLPKEALEFHDLMLSLATHIVVSTQHLFDKFNKKRVNVHLAPNYVDVWGDFDIIRHDDVYRCLGDKGEVFDDLRILWQGSNTHSEDIKIIEDIITKFDDIPIAFYMWGMSPSLHTMATYGNIIKIVKPVNIFNYHKKLLKINPHMVLAPLHDCEFNLSKSNLRILDAWGAVAVPMASNVGEYAKTITHGVNGYVCKTPDDYVKAIREFKQYYTVQENMYKAIQDTVITKYDWASVGIRSWGNVLETVLS